MAVRVVSSTFVAREAELDRLSAALDRALTGQPAVVLVGGEAGVGKTRLIEEGTRLAEKAGARVLIGACVELGGEGLPFAPLVDAMRELARTLSRDELNRMLGSARAELAQLLPELDETAAREAPREVSRARLFEQVLGLITRLAAEQPLALVIEDLHWADRSTLDLVTFLVRAAVASPVLMLVTYRTDEMHRRHPLRPVLVELERLRHVQVIELHRFDRSGVAAQLRGILGEDPEPALVTQVFERSGGNAFLTEEAVALVQGGSAISSSLRDLLLDRVDRLSDPTQRLLRVVAAAGGRVGHQLLEAVADIGEAELHAALREAVEHHVLTVDDIGRGYAFRHLLVREAVAGDSLPGELVSFHTAYARAIEADPALAGTATAASSELAHHWFAAHDLPRALGASVTAARLAYRAYAYSEAYQLASRALEIWAAVPDAATVTGTDHLGLVELAIDAARYADEIDRARALVHQALRDVDRDREPVRTALLLWRLGLIVATRSPIEAIAAIAEAASLVPADPPTRALATVLAELARVQVWSGDFEKAREYGEQALAAARASQQPDKEADALVTYGAGLVYMGQAESGLAHLREALVLAERVGDAEVLMRAYTNLSDCLEGMGLHREAAEVAARGVTAAEQLGLARSWGAFIIGNQAEPLLRLGRLDEADQTVAATALLDPSGIFAAAGELILAEVTLQRGQIDRAEQHIENVRTEFRHSDPGWQFEVPTSYVSAEIYRVRGDLASVRRELAFVLDVHVRADRARYAWPVLWSAIRAEADATLAATGREPAEDARAHVERITALADTLPRSNAAAAAYAELVSAEQARFEGRPDAADQWQRAVDAWRAAGEPYPLGYALTHLAEARLTLGDRDGAQRAAGEALELVRDRGMLLLEGDLLGLVRRGRLAVGAPEAAAASAGATGPALEAAAAKPGADLGLTQREVDVLRLVAQGQSNGQIAGQLYISPKTVSVHVSNILMKLGVSTRGEAAAVAHRRRLFTDP